VRITIDKARKAFSANRSISKADWDSAKQRCSLKCKDAIIISNQLQSIRSTIFETHRILSDQGIYATAEIIYQKIAGKEQKTDCFIDFYKQFLEAKQKLIGGESTPEIYIKHKRLLKKFKEFVFEKHKSSSFGFKNFKTELGKEFFGFLKFNCNLSHNTAVKQMQLFKCVIKAALNKGHFSFNPFYDIKFSLKDVPRPYLTEQRFLPVVYLFLFIQ
jgi:hypothetical protein